MQYNRVLLFCFTVELSRQLKDSGATYIFTDQELAPKAKHSARDTGQIRVNGGIFSVNIPFNVS